MIVAIIDIGSEHGAPPRRLRRPRRRGAARARPLLSEPRGRRIYALGKIGPRKLRSARRVARRFARIARRSGAERLETVVTAPGRQASNGDELVRGLSEKTKAPVVLLSGEDEGRLAWEGAVARMDDPPEVVAVVDLGGGSFELAVGTPALGPAWVRSVDAGALRVTRTHLGGDPPTAERVATARREIRALVADLASPTPDAALAVGGTARASSDVLSGGVSASNGSKSSPSSSRALLWR